MVDFDSVEICYRRMSESEAEATLKNGILVNGREPIPGRNGLPARSDPNKWVTFNGEYSLTYKPKGSSAEDYPILCVFSLVPGTEDMLRNLKGEKAIRKGPRNGFGITQSLVPWFNRRIRGLNFYDLRRETPTLLKEPVGRYVLMHRDNVVVFQTFSPDYICASESRFTDRVGLSRMSWLKTSLLWTLWRSDWGRKVGQERVLSIELKPDYLSGLERIAVSSKDPESGKSSVVVQKDPDRRIIGWRWRSPENHHYWVKAGITAHFGLRGEQLTSYLFEVVPGNLADITDVIRQVELEKPEHPTSTLYDLLGYTLTRR